MRNPNLFRGLALSILSSASMLLAFSTSITIDANHNNPIQVSLAGDPAQAWIGKVLRDIGVEKALEWCIPNGGCPEALKGYSKQMIRNRRVQNELLFIRQKRTSPLRAEYEKKSGTCPNDNAWLNIVHTTDF
jgi:hypothetical protein